MKKFLLVLNMVIVIYFNILPVWAGETVYQTYADSETLDGYKTALMDSTPNTRHSGRVWTDKTVFDNSQNAVVIDNHTFNYEDDFLEVYSAIGSNSSIGVTKGSPIDLVVLFDCSPSMAIPIAQSENESSTLLIQEAAKNLNLLIDQVMAQNKQNRIAIVVYQSFAKTVFPLNRYSRVDNEDYLKVNVIDNPGLQKTFDLNFKGFNGSEIIETDVKSLSLGAATNMQLAYKEGLKLLADTDYDPSKDVNKPKIITLSDGVPTTFHDGPWNEEVNLEDPLHGNRDLDGFKLYQKENEWNQAAALQTTLTAAYYKAAVEKKYACPAEIYLFWIKNDDSIEEDAEALKSYKQILNIDNYLNSSSESEDELTKSIQELFKKWQENSEDPIEIDSGTEGFPAQIVRFPAENKYGITLEELLKNTQFIDTFESVPITEESEFLKGLIDSYSSNEFHPIDEESSTEDSNMLVYTEPIGEYLHVCPMKVLLFDQEYELQKANELNDSIKRVEIYSPVNTVRNNQSVVNEGYSLPVECELSAIQFILETQGTQQNLTIKIPESILPVINTNVSYKQEYDNNKDKVIHSITDNRYSKFAKPIRFIYGVDLMDSVLNQDGTVNMQNISEEYKASYYDGKSITFNTTDYQGQKAAYNNQLSVGEAVTRFTPAHDNPYYRAQKELQIYKDSKCQNELKESDNINEDKDYYVKKEYYGIDSNEAKLLYETNSLKGSMIKSGIDLSQNSEDSISLLPDTNCIGDLHEFSVQKEENITDTASLVYYPVIDETQNNPNEFIHTQLGNNGKMALTVSFDININITKYQAIGENSLTKDRLTVSASDIITYQLDVNNTSNANVENVLITDKIPTGLKIVPDSISNSGIFLIDTLTWIIDVPANSTVSLSYKVLVPEAQQAVYKNFFTIEYEENGKSIERNSNTVEAVQGSPNINLVKYQSVNGKTRTQEKQTVNGGDQLTYYFEVSNKGTHRADNVKVTDNIPNDLVLVKDSISDEGELNNNQISWIIDHLEPNETVLRSFSVTIPALSTHSYWRNIAYATHEANPTPLPSNEVEIEKPQWSIKIEKMQSTQSAPTPTTNTLSVNAKEIVTYYLNITNNSPLETIKNLTIWDQVPSDLQIIEDSISNYGSEMNNKITWLISSLAPGESLSLSFQVSVPPNKQEGSWKNFAVLNTPDYPEDIQSNTVEIVETDQPVQSTSVVSNNSSNTKSDSKADDSKTSNTSTNNSNDSNTSNTSSSTTDTNRTNSVTETGINPKTGINESDMNAFIWLISLGCVLLLTSQAIRGMK